MVQRSSKKRQETSVLQVFIFHEGRFWGTECFSQTSMVIGRSPDVDLQIEDDVVSRTHARLSVSSEGVVLEDLGSSNGTFVNGEPIERCYLESLDEINLGEYTLKIKLLGKKKAEARFKDETRIMGSSGVVKDDRTEIVQAEDVDEGMLVEGSGSAEPAEIGYPDHEDTFHMVDQAPAEPVPEPTPVRGRGSARREEIAAALREELGGDAGFERPRTEKIAEVQPEIVVEQVPETVEEYVDETQVESPPDFGVTGGPEDPSSQWLDPAPSAEPEEGEQKTILTEFVPPTAAQPDVYEQEFAPAPAVAVDAAIELDLPAQAKEPAIDSMLPGFEPKVEAAAPVEHGLEEPEPALDGNVAAPVDGDEEGEEEEDEYERDFVEPFSLLNNLIRENFAQPQVATDTTPVVEIIGYSQEKQVLTYDQIARGKRFRFGSKKFVLVQYNDQAACNVMFTDDFAGGVITGGRTVAVDELKTATNQVATRKGQNIYRYKLMKGDYANLIHDGGGSFLRFVNPPKMPPAPRGKIFDPTSMKIFGSAFLAHVLVIVVLGFFAKEAGAANDADIDRFAKIDIKDIQMELPPEEAEVPLDMLPEPEIAKEEEKVDEKKEEKKEEPKKEPKKKTKSRKRSKKKAKGGDGGDGGGVGMMAALGNLSKKKSSTNIVAAVSNLDAVRVPGGRSRYKVSGLVTKLPTSSVVVSRGRGAGVKAGIDLLRGGKGRGGKAGIGPGALGGGRIGKRKVGGVVFKAPKRKMKVRGHLSREAIAKVVRQHLREVQYCYEKNLLLSPNLTGKVIMEWTISTSGSVTVVKTKKNTMATPAVAMCISSKIKGWKFPKPKGGIVVVSYPFIFNSIGF